MRRAIVSLADRDLDLADLPSPLPLDRLVPGPGPWEVEIGFGKGRYLLRRAGEESGERFLGVEMAAKYHRLACGRMRRRGLRNLVLVRAEAAYVMASALPRRFARAAHVYFPDPWPKERHHQRRLLDVDSIDLLLDLLLPGGTLYFASDHLEYAALVGAMLESHPTVRLRRHRGAWPDGARTNYEVKYARQGRPVERLEAVRVGDGEPAPLHPAGRLAVLAASVPRTGG